MRNYRFDILIPVLTCLTVPTGGQPASPAPASSNTASNTAAANNARVSTGGGKKTRYQDNTNAIFRT